MKFKSLALFFLLLLLTLSASAENANAPWHLLNGGFDSTIRGAWLLPLPDAPADATTFKLFQDAVLFMGADQGGVSRSVLLDVPRRPIWRANSASIGKSSMAVAALAIARAAATAY